MVRQKVWGRNVFLTQNLGTKNGFFPKKNGIGSTQMKTFREVGRKW